MPADGIGLHSHDRTNPSSSHGGCIGASAIMLR